MAAKSSSERHHHHKHSKHKHKHKHGSSHHSHGKHKKKKKHKKSSRERRGRSETPEIKVDERELQVALETLEDALIEQCLRSESSGEDEETSDAPPIASPPIHTPHPDEEPLNCNSLSEHTTTTQHNSLKPLLEAEHQKTDYKTAIGEGTAAAKLSVALVETEAVDSNCVDTARECQGDKNSEREMVTSAQALDGGGGEERGEREGEEEKGKEERGGEEGEGEKGDCGEDWSGREGGEDRDSSDSGTGSDLGNIQLTEKPLNLKPKNKMIQINISVSTDGQATATQSTEAVGDREREKPPVSTDSPAATGEGEVASHHQEDGGVEEREAGEEEGEGRRRGGRKRSSSGHRRRKRHRESSGRDGQSRRSVPRSSSHSPRRRHSRSHSRSRRSSPRSKRGRHSRSRSHSRSRPRSPYHSRSKRHRSRSLYRSSRRGSPSRSSRDSRYRGRENPGRFPRRHRSRSRSRTRSRSPQRSSSSRRRRRERRRRRRSYSSESRSKSRSPPERDGREEGEGGVGLVGDAQVQAVVKEMAAKVKQVHINKFTALCVDLQKRQEWEDQGGEETAYDPLPAARAPFQLSQTPAYQSGLVLHNNVWKTPNQIVAESNVLQAERPLTEKFPVSCGIEHQQQENTLGPSHTATEDVSVFSGSKPTLGLGELAQKRLEASQRLQKDPMDLEAQQILAFVESQASAVLVKPGQFTGRKQLNALTPEDHKTGLQAWIKKDMFKGLAPVLSGFGMKMLKKMGWTEGQPLGKKGKGVTEPIPMSVKVDRAGLSTVQDKSQPIVPVSAMKASTATSKSAHFVSGKHPVSALQEICAKKHWDPPHYELINSSGPSHQMNFLFKVVLPCGSFQPAVASNNKKQAKAQAALACLQGLGLVEK